MANRPANAGSGRGLAPVGDVAPPLDPAAPPPVHHDAPRVSRPSADAPRADAVPAPPTGAPRAAAGHQAEAGHQAAVGHQAEAGHQAAVGHRTARRRAAREREDAGTSVLAWVPYLIVLAGAAAGMFIAWQGPKYAGRGTALLGGSLLVAALFRLVLPPRYAGLLSSRGKASDVLAFAVFGSAVLGVALMLP